MLCLARILAVLVAAAGAAAHAAETSYPSKPVSLSASPAEFDAYVRAESKRWDKIIRDNGVRTD